MTEPLDLARIRQGLHTQWLGQTMQIRDVTQSTMDDVREAAERGAVRGHVVIAESQRAGRGARGRSWDSPPGDDIYFSFLYSEAKAIEERAPITLIVGLGLRNALAKWVPNSDIAIKWPNDLLINNRKCAGILVEARSVGTETAMIIGVGLNVNREQWSPELQPMATSLHAEIGMRLNRSDVVAHVFNALETELAQAERKSPSTIAGELNAHLAWRNREVRVEEQQGRLLGVNDRGELELATEHGIVACQSGHVELQER